MTDEGRIEHLETQMSTVTQRLDEISSLLIRLVPENPPNTASAVQSVGTTQPSHTGIGRPSLSEYSPINTADEQIPHTRLPVSLMTLQRVIRGGITPWRRIRLAEPRPIAHPCLNGPTGLTIPLSHRSCPRFQLAMHWPQVKRQRMAKPSIQPLMGYWPI